MDEPGAEKLDLQPVPPVTFRPRLTIPGGESTTAGVAGQNWMPLINEPEENQRRFVEGLTAPAMPIPRIPQQKGRLAQLAAGTINAGLSIPEFMESPLGMFTLPLGATGKVGQRALQAGYGGYMASQVPAAAREAGRQSVEGTLQEATEADVNLGGNVVLPAVLGKGMIGKGEATVGSPGPGDRTAGPAVPATVSEFGGDAPQALDLQPVVSPESPVLSPQSTLETATPTVQPTVAPVAPGANLNVTDLAATARIAEMPESVDTLNHQLDALRAGKRQAVLFTPGETVPKWAQDSDQYSTHETPAGTFLYDAAEITKDQIDEHVAKNTVGRLLGYGIDAKPAPADTIGAVTVRSAQGIEKQSVLTDKENLPGVLQAAQAMAAPGDSVRLESPAAVLNAPPRIVSPGRGMWSSRMIMSVFELPTTRIRGEVFFIVSTLDWENME